MASYYPHDLVVPPLEVSWVYGKNLPQKVIYGLSLWKLFSAILHPDDIFLAPCYEWTLGLFEHSGVDSTVLFNPLSSFGRAILRMSPRDRLSLLALTLFRGLLYQSGGVTFKRILPLLPKKRNFFKNRLLKHRLQYYYIPFILPSPTSQFDKRLCSFQIILETQDVTSKTTSSYSSLSVTTLMFFPVPV